MFKNRLLVFLKRLSISIDYLIDSINGSDNSFNIDFEKFFEQYINLSQHEDLDDYCNNVAFGYFLGKENDTRYNRYIYAKLLNAYISKKVKDN